MTMRRLILAAALLIAGLVPAVAQNICPTAPFGTTNNQCASTAFVVNQITGTASTIVVGSTPVTSGVSGRVLYDNAGVLGEYIITGSGNAVLSTSPSLTTPSLASPNFTGTVTGSNTIPLTILQQSAANTMLGNWSGVTANVSANAMPSCADSGGQHLNYVSGTGITCGTGTGNAITALTGDVTATGPGSVAATLATAQPGAHTWAATQTFTLAPVFTDASGTRTALALGTAATQNTGTSGANLPFLNGVNTWSGANTFSGGASVAGLTVTGSFTATGLVGNASLVNSATTVNGQTCTLGSTCTITATAADIQVGVTTVSSGTTTRILYDNAGVLGEYTLTGTGTVVVMQNTPTLTTPVLGVATATSIAIAGCTIGTDELCVTGQTSLGATTLSAALTYGGVTLANAVTGTGNMVLATSPTLTTPALGAATATSINGLTITSSTGTLTVTNAKTASFSNSITFAGTDGTTMTFPNASATIPRVVASGAKALATSAIGSAACSSAQTDTATGTLTTDAVMVSFSADPTATTGYVPLTSGMLTIIYYPTADTVNFKVCNNTAASITPGAVTINWRVIR